MQWQGDVHVFITCEFAISCKKIIAIVANREQWLLHLMIMLVSFTAAGAGVTKRWPLRFNYFSITWVTGLTVSLHGNLVQWCCWFSSLLRGFFSGFSGVTPSTKTNTRNSNSIRKWGPLMSLIWLLLLMKTLLMVQSNILCQNITIFSMVDETFRWNLSWECVKPQVLHSIYE